MEGKVIVVEMETEEEMIRTMEVGMIKVMEEEGMNQAMEVGMIKVMEEEGMIQAMEVEMIKAMEVIKTRQSLPKTKEENLLLSKRTLPSTVP